MSEKIYFLAYVHSFMFAGLTIHQKLLQINYNQLLSLPYKLTSGGKRKQEVTQKFLHSCHQTSKTFSLKREVVQSPTRVQ